MPMKEPNDIGEFLKTLRGRMSLREAADRSGLSHSYINSLEKGEHPKTKAPIKPTPETLERLSRAYNYSYEELMSKAGYIKEDGQTIDTKLDAKILTEQKKKLLDRYDKLPKDKQHILDQLAEVMIKELGLDPDEKNGNH